MLGNGAVERVGFVGAAEGEGEGVVRMGVNVRERRVETRRVTGER
jgi:hypothetical protein